MNDTNKFDLDKERRYSFMEWNEAMFQKYGNERLYHHSSKIIRHIQARRLNVITKLVRLNPQDALLDAGTGEGYLFSKLPACRLAVGVDLSWAALKIARERQYGGIQWIEANLSTLPFDDESFDKIVCSEVIEHVPNPMSVLAELWRVLKPCGTIVLTVPHERRLNMLKDYVLSSRLGRHIFPGIPLRTEWHLTEYNAKLLKGQIAGFFEIVSEQTLPYQLLDLGFAAECTKTNHR